MSARQVPVRGSFVVDTARDAIGEVMDHVEALIQLRPLQGGLEWDAKPAEVRPATFDEVLSAKVRIANSSRQAL
ncbi:hypothetical protein [Streptomyces orinoci]|uniref:Uncharacterized protein n=1 Tax=Streptomyces orinoci TaxID=67339 RepID=A0ABV3JYZ1_STRON|nr:hypothetical protein [Streptomyces orinoci]